MGIRALDAGYVDYVALERQRNPFYRENPPGVANEPVELSIVFGMADFLLYVLAIYPLASAFQACFYLWCLTIPFGFLSTVMPVGPISTWYWRRSHPRQTLKPIGDLGVWQQELLARRHQLQAFAVETVMVENE